MKVAVHKVPINDLNEVLKTLVELGKTYAVFGDRVLTYGPDLEWETLIKTANLTTEEYESPVRREDLHLVIQTGALFEQAHPEVPIILNASRHLVAVLDPLRVTEINASRSGFKIKPLAPNTIVFDVRTPSQNVPVAASPISNIVEQLSLPNLQKGLEDLTRFPTRHSSSPHYSEAAQWAIDQLDQIGYKTLIDPITVKGTRSKNVIAAEGRRRSSKDQIVLVVAHLDSINEANHEWVAPGADDNASGSAALIEMARVLWNNSGVNELRFVLFGGEEDGLFGSDQYVKLLRSKKELSRVKAVICMDMIGTKLSDKPTVLIEGSAISQPIIDGLTNAAVIYSPDLTVTSSLYHYTSDHMPFIWAGIPAVLTIEGNGDKGNDNIHTEHDDLSHIDYELMMAILRMNTAFIAECLDLHPKNTHVR